MPPMSNMPPSHGLLDIIQHTWGIISGLFLVVFTVIGWWWTDKKHTKKRILNLEIIAEQVVTKSDLRECKEAVDKNRQDALSSLSRDIKNLGDKNEAQHNDIMSHVIKLYEKEK